MVASYVLKCPVNPITKPNPVYRHLLHDSMTKKNYHKGPRNLAQLVMLVSCVREVPYKTLGRDVGYRNFVGVTHSLQADTDITAN
jgi:hypothetical protein